MKLLNVLQQLYCEPWLVLPAMHKTMCEIVHDHITGAAHMLGGRAETFINPQEPEQPQGLRVPDGVAVLDLYGVIGQRVGELERSSGVTDVGDFVRQIAEAEGREDVGGVLLRIDSPGGTVTGIPEAGKAVARVAQVKPVVAYTDGLMASAAYWIGSQADMIVATESAQVGSIGVYQAFLDNSRQHEMNGLKMELFKTGDFKGMGMPGLSLTDKQRELIQSRVDEVYGWFVEAVTARRDIPVDAMQGQTFRSIEAMDNDLIDTIGSEVDAMQEISALMRMKTEGRRA